MNISNLNINGFYLDETVKKKIKLTRYVKDKENWIDIILPCNDINVIVMFTHKNSIIKVIILPYNEQDDIISEEIEFYLPKEMK